MVDGKEYRLGQEHDAQDRVTAVTYPDGVRLEYRYNERGLLDSVPRVVRRLEYDARGLATRREYSNGVVSTADYDERERIKLLGTTDSSGKTLQDLKYGYNQVGTLLSIEDRVRASGRLSSTRLYSYDDLYRLKYAQSPIGTASFSYDGVGNLLEKSGYGSYVYGGPQPNAVQSIGGTSVGHDSNGSVVASFGRTLEYDPHGDLRRVTGADGSVSEYLYDLDGHRVVKKVTAEEKTRKVVYIDRFAEDRDGQIVKYVFAGDVRLARVGGGTPKQVALAAMKSSGQMLGALAYLAIGLGVLGMATRRGEPRRFFRRVTAGGLTWFFVSCNCGGGVKETPLEATIFYTADHLGTGELLTDGAGNVVSEARSDAWGLQVVATDDPYGFTGKEWDSEAGLFYFGARYYDPRIGRFVSVDPVALNESGNSVRDPQTLNPYSYARNTPTILRDRHGMAPEGTGNLLAPEMSWSDRALTAARNAAAGFLGFNVGAMQGIVPFGESFGPRMDSAHFEVARGVRIMAAGAGLIVAGVSGVGIGAGGGLATAPSGVGLVAGGAVALASAAVAVYGGYKVYVGLRTFGNGLTLMKKGDQDSGKKIADGKVVAPPPQRGCAPIGCDGHPVELHHRNQTPTSPLDEMTRTEHRGKGNFSANHSNTGQEPSKIDRTEWKKEQRAYWTEEWDNGRFEDVDAK